jgi:hypothetical protein
MCSATRFRSDGVLAWLSAATAATSPGVCTASSSASEASTGASRSQQSARNNKRRQTKGALKQGKQAQGRAERAALHLKLLQAVACTSLPGQQVDAAAWVIKQQSVHGRPTLHSYGVVLAADHSPVHPLICIPQTNLPSTLASKPQPDTSFPATAPHAVQSGTKSNPPAFRMTVAQSSLHMKSTRCKRPIDII